MYYSPEKHQLFKDTLQEQAQNTCAEIERYWVDKNLTINDYSSVEKQNLILKREMSNYLIQISAQSWMNVHYMALYMWVGFLFN